MPENVDMREFENCSFGEIMNTTNAAASDESDAGSAESPAFHLQLPDGHSRPSTTASIANAFDQDGFVVLSQAIHSTFLKEWQAFSNNYFHWSFQVLNQLGHTQSPSFKDSAGNYTLGLGAKHGFREIVMRSPGRFELSLLNLEEERFRDVLGAKTGLCDAFRIPDVNVITSVLEPLLLMLFGKNSMKDLKCCHVSLLVAVPGSSDQAWHADGGHVSLTEHLSCHCLNIFIPLHDVPRRMGPTEFRPGGHYLTRNLAAMMLAAKCRKTLRAPVWPALIEQDVVVFDYRVLHRGRANTTQINRHVLVLTYCEPWFEDVVNFPKRSMLDPA